MSQLKKKILCQWISSFLCILGEVFQTKDPEMRAHVQVFYEGRASKKNGRGVGKEREGKRTARFGLPVRSLLQPGSTGSSGVNIRTQNMFQPEVTELQFRTLVTVSH